MLRFLIAHIFALRAATAAMSITLKLQNANNDMYTKSFDTVFELDVAFDGDISMNNSLKMYMEYPSHADSVVFDLSRQRNTDHYFTGFNVDQEKAQLMLKEGKNTNKPFLIAGAIFLKDGSNILINTRQNHTYWMRETFWSENYHTDGIVISPTTDSEKHGHDIAGIEDGQVIGDLSILIDNYQNNTHWMGQSFHSEVSRDEFIVISSPTIDDPTQDFEGIEEGEVTVDILIAYTEAAMVRRI
jgi:hypothetical protein